jgi:UDP-glucose 4-epimerase
VAAESSVICYVTGVAGFLGAAVAQLLVDDGHEVHGCDTFVTGSADRIPAGVKFSFGDVRHLNHLPDGCDLVVHCAAIARSGWPNRVEMRSVNIDGTENVARLAADRRLVHASSCVVSTPTVSEYARSKTLAESWALRSTRAVALRYSNIYGPGQSETGAEPNVIASWRRQLRETGTVRVDGDGTQLRDFLHVDDAARATVLAAFSTAAGWYDICTGRPAPIIDVARQFNAPIVHAPLRPRDPFMFAQDPRPAEQAFGFRAAIPFEVMAHAG